jgi:broad specificity phosphatase PhoE
MPAIKLYLFRHAESQANTRPHIISGRRNESLLTEHGIDQARMLGRYLSAHKIIPTRVYSSPAVRTLRTATFALETMGLDIRPTADDALQEMNQGDWVGHIRHEVYSDETLADVKRLGKNFKAPNGESMNEVSARMHTWANQFFDDNFSSAKTENIFVFTHGVAIGCFGSTLCDWSQNQTYRTIQTIDNCSISLFIHDSGEWRLEYLGMKP